MGGSYDYELLDALNRIAKSAERTAESLENLAASLEQRKGKSNTLPVWKPGFSSAEERKTLDDIVRKVLEDQVRARSVWEHSQTVGQRIKAARKAAGLTQQQLAEKSGLKYQNITKWERGERNPKIETLLKISEACGCSVMYLTFGKEEK